MSAVLIAICGPSGGHQLAKPEGYDPRAGPNNFVSISVPGPQRTFHYRRRQETTVQSGLANRPKRVSRGAATPLMLLLCCSGRNRTAPPTTTASCG